MCFRMFNGLNKMILLVFYLKWVMSLGHRPVIVKRALIGSKCGWKLSIIFLSCKVFHDWSIIKLRKYIVFIRLVYLCCTF